MIEDKDGTNKSVFLHYWDFSLLGGFEQAINSVVRSFVNGKLLSG